MPKRPNAKKMASQAYAKIKALDAAAQGEFQIARVEKSIGYCQFLAQLDTGSGLRQVTVLIRGKFKGGKNCATRVEPGCFVLVDGDQSKTMEVVGVVNRQNELDRLRGTKRVSRALESVGAEAAGGGGDEYEFEEETEGGEQGDIWAKRDSEREALASELLSRYQRHATAGKDRHAKISEGAAAALEDEEAEEEAPAAEDGGAAAPAGKKPITSERRLRAMAARAAAEQASAAELEHAETAELTAMWAAGAAAAAAAEREEAEFARTAAAAAEAFRNRKAPKSWEDDEIDIDAI